jgi:hypothetical protein
MTMSAKTTAAEETKVVLLHLGVGKQEFALPSDATLSDLLREAQVELSEYDAMVDGRNPEECLVLGPDTIVSLVPRPRGGKPSESWRETIGMFRDDPVFQEMVDAGKAHRDAERQAARNEPDGNRP